MSDIVLPQIFHEMLTPPLGSYRYRVAYGGRGSGKSYNFAIMLLALADQKPTRILCLRAFQNSIKDSTWRDLKGIIDRYDLPNFTVTDREIRHSNGSIFIFKGCQNPSEIKSTSNIDLCFVEEAAKITEEGWETIIPTIRNPHSEIWAVFNPEREDDPTYQRFVVNPPDNAIIKKVNWDQNPYFPAVLREEMLELEKRDYKKFLHVWQGHPDVFFEGDPVYGESYFKEEIHCKNKEFQPGEILLSFDLGRGYPAAVIAQQQDEQLVILREILRYDIQLKNFIDIVLQEANQCYGYGPPKFWTTCDSVASNGNPVVEQTQLDIFHSKGLYPSLKYQRVQPGIDLIKERLTKVGKNFEPLLVIHPSCQNLIEGLKGGYQLDKNGAIKKDNKYDNAQDALRFLVVNRYGFIERKPVLATRRKPQSSYSRGR